MHGLRCLDLQTVTQSSSRANNTNATIHYIPFIRFIPVCALFGVCFYFFLLVPRQTKQYLGMELSGFYCVLLVACFFPFSHALECYVCTNQEGNREKCLKSTKTCEQGQDSCFTEIKWGSTPYWSRGAKKQFYVSKRCSTKKECERIKQNNMNDCTYIWYQDWKCSDCCQGDKCNYFVISAARQVYARWTTLAIALVSLYSVRNTSL